MPPALMPSCFPLGWGKLESGEFRGRTAVRVVPETRPVSARAAALFPTFPGAALGCSSTTVGWAGLLWSRQLLPPRSCQLQSDLQ